jgi:hypothetical protein
MHLAVAQQLEEPREELYSRLYEYAEQGRWFCQVGRLCQNQSTPGAETSDRESVPPPENEGTLAAWLDVAADVAGAGLTNNGSGGGGELRAEEASHRPDSSSEPDTNTRKCPPDDSLDNEHVGRFGTNTRKRPSDEQLGHETAGGLKTDTRKHPPDEQLDCEPAGGGSALRIRTGAPAVVGGTMSRSGLLTRAGGGLHPLAQGVQLTRPRERKCLHNQNSQYQRRRHG